LEFVIPIYVITRSSGEATDDVCRISLIIWFAFTPPFLKLSASSHLVQPPIK